MAEQKRVWNLAKQFAEFKTAHRSEGWSGNLDLSSFTDELADYCLGKGSVSLFFNKRPCFIRFGRLACLIGNTLHEKIGNISYIDTLKIDVENSNPTAVLLKSFKRPTKAMTGFKRMPLVNADVDVNSYYSTLFKGARCPLVSFQCLERLLSPRTTNRTTTLETTKAWKLFDRESLKVMDWTDDETRELNKEEKAQLKKHQKDEHKIPAPASPLGFMLQNPPLSAPNWHRAGHVLINGIGKSFLLGSDEGTYFGVELPKVCTSIEQAFDVLAPREVKGKVFVRQGEWFMSKIWDEEVDKRVPKVGDCLATFECIDLPREDDLSNRHVLSSNEGRIGKDGRIFAKNPNVEHDEHRAMSGKGWWTFDRNTAKRSVSAEGVD